MQTLTCTLRMLHTDNAERANVCIAVLCGLPGAGKTTLCKALLQIAGEHVEIKHTCFDDPLPDDLYESQEWGKESACLWKASRENVFYKLQEDLKGRGRIHQPLLVLLDDNMYYRSMRLDCARLACQLEAAFIVIYIPCNLEVASARNVLRSKAEQVPQEVLNRMAARLEPPNPGRHAWEQHTVTLASEALPRPSDLNDQGWAGVWEAVLGAWGPPLPKAVPPEPKGPPTAASATAAHDVDLRSRRALAAAIAGVASREGKAAAADRLNAARRDLLARLEKDEDWRDIAAKLADFQQLCTAVADEYCERDS